MGYPLLHGVSLLHMGTGARNPGHWRLKNRLPALLRSRTLQVEGEQAAPAGHAAAHVLPQQLPWNSAAEDEDDAGQGGPVRDAGSATLDREASSTMTPSTTHPNAVAGETGPDTSREAPGSPRSDDPLPQGIATMVETALGWVRRHRDGRQALSLP